MQSETKRQPYSLTVVGGTKIPVSTLGIPHTKLVSMTTFSQAQKIISAFIDESGKIPSVCLYGYGDNGITAEKTLQRYLVIKKTLRILMIIVKITM